MIPRFRILIATYTALLALTACAPAQTSGVSVGQATGPDEEYGPVIPPAPEESAYLRQAPEEDKQAAMPAGAGAKEKSELANKLEAGSLSSPPEIKDIPLIRAAIGGFHKKLVTEISTKALYPQAMTLRDAIAQGILTNPQYGAVANNRLATNEDLIQARSLYLPSVDVRAGGGREYTDSPYTRSLTSTRTHTEIMWRNSVNLTLTQLLFDGWKSFYEQERQKNRVLSAANRVREAGELIALSTVQAYLEVLRQRELLAIDRDNIRAHLALMKQIQDSTDAGRTTQADVEQSRARLAAARTTEASTRESLRVAEADFIRQVGVPPADLIMPQTPFDLLEGDLGQEVTAALSQNPTIDIFEADYKAAHSQTRGARSGYLMPRVDFQLQGRQSHNAGGVAGLDKGASAEVVMNWNLYRGGADTAALRQQGAREAQAREDRIKAARGVESDVRQTWARMVSAGEKAREFATQVKANTAVVKAYKDQFDLNRRSLLDVLDSQNELLLSQSNAVNAQYLEMFAVYRLLALKGELLKTLGVDLPKGADPDTL